MLVRNIGFVVAALALPLASVMLKAGDVASDGVPGMAVYQAHCASCHGEDLTGKFGPALKGSIFQAKWTSASSAALLTYIKANMPPAGGTALSDKDYAAVGAYLTQVNHLPPSPAQAASPQANAAEGSAESTARLEAFSRRGPTDIDAQYRAVLDRRAGILQALTPVSDVMLRTPPANDWLMWRRTLDLRGYSPLTQISSSNVGNLKLDWSASLSPGINGIAPVVHDGVMFLIASDKVIALDATNGDLLWEHGGLASSTNRVPLTQARGVALYEDKVIAPSMDGRILALDAHSGKLIWEQRVFGPDDGLQLTAQPLIANGKILQGVSGCSGPNYKGGCYIAALDADSGKELWRFHTIARPGQPGGDSWNGAPVDERYGGSVWVSGSYDPDLNLAYFGVGQTYHIDTLLMPNKRKGASADALFTDSTLALDPDTGKLVWYFQHLPGDVWDLDYAFERTLVTVDGPRGRRKAVVTGGKDSIFDVLDAKTGKYLYSGDMGVQSLVKSIDPRTGRKTINPAAIFGPGKDATLCPFVGGGRDWPSTAWDSEKSLLFVPMIESCMSLKMPSGDGDRLTSWQLKKVPDSDGKFGRVAALNLATRKIEWVNRRRATPSSAMLATAGGILFEGSRDRTLRALESATGKTLWETRLSETPNSFPISYMVNGVQYIAVVLGGGTVQDVLYRSFTPEIAASNGSRSIWVFRLKQ